MGLDFCFCFLKAVGGFYKILGPPTMAGRVLEKLRRLGGSGKCGAQTASGKTKNKSVRDTENQAAEVGMRPRALAGGGRTRSGTGHGRAVEYEEGCQVRRSAKNRAWRGVTGISRNIGHCQRHE